MTRILIVDSNLPFLMRLRKALEKEGHNVRAISRPRPALRELAQAPFEVAVVDLHIDWVEMPQFIKDMRARQPNLPIVLTGQYPEDPEQVGVLNAQGYLNKPYLARDLLPVVQMAIERGYQASARDFDVIATSDFSDVPSFDVLMEMALNQSATAHETGLSEDTTLGELINSLHDEAVEEDIRQHTREHVIVEPPVDSMDTPPMPELVIPDDEIGVQTRRFDIVDERAEAAGQTRRLDPETLTTPDKLVEERSGQGVEAALKIANSNLAMEKLLSNVEAWVNRTGEIHVHPLPSWSIEPTPEEAEHQRLLLNSIHMSPEEIAEPQPFEEPPVGAQTQPITLPDVDLYLDDTDTPIIPMPAANIESMDLGQVVEDAGIEQEVADIPVPTLDEILAREEDELVPVSIEEITQAMGIILDEEDDEDEDEHRAFETIEPSPDDEAVEELLEEVNLVGHATLQLIELSLESTARAILLTNEDEIVAQTGELPQQIWHDIHEAVERAWERSGTPDMRLVYEDIEHLGNILLCSLHTIQHLKLTLVFPAETHVGTIRKQAAVIRDALEKIPEAELQDLDSEEAEAPPTLPSRPTDFEPPVGLQEAISLEQPVQREPGTYMGYAVVWLLGQHEIDLTKPFAEAMVRWIERMAQEHDWDIQEVEVGKSWVNVHISVPVKTYIGEVVSHLMNKTNHRLLEALGLDPENDLPLWFEGYCVSTPGRLFEHEEIREFAEYYKEETLY